MPRLDWIGKDKVVNHHLEVPYRVLDRVYSFDESGQHDTDNGSGNMIIHGDNLEALKALLPQYEGRVKCIYIDPPYNTGNEGWVYNDNVNDPQMVDWLNKVVGKEGEDLSRHDKWLCMMYPRLRLLQKLLADDGVIFISIDDNELYNLKSICDEVFGIRNFVANIIWQKTYSPRNDSGTIPYETDSILVYSKTNQWKPNTLSRTEKMDSIYKSPDNDPVLWTSGDPCAADSVMHQGMVFAIQHPVTGAMMYPPAGSHWRIGQQELLAIMNEWAPYELADLHDEEERARLCNITAEQVRKEVKGIVLSVSIETAQQAAKERYAMGNWPLLYFTSGGKGGLRRKRHLEDTQGRKATNLWPFKEVGHTDEAKKELKVIFDGRAPFDTPKPSRLLERILQIATDPDSIILDSFAGSGTTAHAVLKANASDGGNRRFILVELMDYADTITAERVKRVISGYRATEERILFDEEITMQTLADGPDILVNAKEIAKEAKGHYSKVSKPKIEDGHLRVVATIKASDKVPGIPGDFSFYELGAPLFIGENLNEDVGADKIREYVYFMETKQRLAPSGEEPYLLGTHVGNAYYFYYERDRATTLNREFLHTIKTPADHYVIYADLCVFTEEELERYRITFKKIPRDITRL